jgi:mannose-1-phosphate guanylyltransferase
MIVLPADHVITSDAQFQTAIRQAAALVDERPGRIVTFGIRPTYAAEGFGYIERGDALGPPAPAGGGGSLAATYHVKKFREKPKGALAQEYFESGRFYWNSGIFVWRAATILAALQTHEPAMARHLQVIASAFGTAQFASAFEREFTALEGKSIDYAVMEHHADVAVIEAPFRWDDVGSWQALARSLPADEQGNTIIGRHLGIRTTGCIVRTDQRHLVATLGLRDTLVVHTPDATLVANKHDEESVRQVVQLLEERGWTEYL